VVPVTTAQDEDLAWFAACGESFRVAHVDGVPVVHIGAPGPVRAGLAFRVGSADETLPQRGLTHLVEHLALHGQLGVAEHRNGVTGGSVTQFTVSGSEQQVVTFLNHVCAALRELPVERLEAERSILRVEAQGRQGSADDRILQVRYGASGLARGTYWEFGAEIATADEVIDWARRWFVTGNAVAWVTTDHLPEGLGLRLPEGERKVFVASPSILTVSPVWIEGSNGGALVEAMVDRSTAAALFTEVMAKSLFRQLRLERGYSYSAGATYEPLDSDRARVVVFADANSDATEDMVDALADALSELRDGQFDPNDVADAREQGRETHRHWTAAPASLLGAATRGYLLGGPPWHPDDFLAEREAVSEADLAAVAREFWNDAIWQTPAAPERAEGVVAAPRSSHSPVKGLSYFHALTGHGYTFGERGVSIGSGDDSASVYFGDCALAVQWGDGGRAVVGGDGVVIQIEPTVLYLFGEQELARFDAALPQDVIVRLPARSADAVPQPPLAARTSSSGLGVWAAVVAILLAGISTQFLIIAVARTVAVGQPDQYGEPISVASAITAWAIGLAFLGGAIALAAGWAHRIRSSRRQS
jgi:zinc protease